MRRRWAHQSAKRENERKEAAAQVSKAASANKDVSPSAARVTDDAFASNDSSHSAAMEADVTNVAPASKDAFAVEAMNAVGLPYPSLPTGAAGETRTDDAGVRDGVAASLSLEPPRSEGYGLATAPAVMCAQLSLPDRTRVLRAVQVNMLITHPLAA